MKSLDHIPVNNPESALDAKREALKKAAPIEAQRIISEIEGDEEMSLFEKAMALDEVIDSLQQGDSYNDNRYIAYILMRNANALRKEGVAEKAVKEASQAKQEADMSV